MTARRIKLIISSNLEDVFLVGNVVNRLCMLGPFSSAEIYRIELAIVESVNNAIKHAYNNERGHEVEIVFGLHSNRLTFAVYDAGKAMAPQHQPPYATSPLQFDPTELDALPESGIGLAIIREVMDEVTYTSCQGRNALTLMKRFPAHETGH